MQITDEHIDKAAKALRERQMAGRITLPWSLVAPRDKKKWRDTARIVLEAALSPNPKE